MKVGSLFSGIGGIDLGFQRAGFDVVWANEKDSAACRTYCHNFGKEYLIERDIYDIDFTMLPKIDVLVAGFPCQSFSVGGKQKGFDDARGQLFFEVVRAVEALSPSIVFLENVENLMDHDGGKTFQVIYSSLAELGYMFRYKPMATHEYANIPQSRRRIYIVAFRDYQKCQHFVFPDPIELTVYAGDLLDTQLEQHEIYYYRSHSQFDEYIRQNVSEMGRFYRVFNGRITYSTQRKCPTLTASMTSPRNAVTIKDNWGVRRLTLKEALRFQGFPPDYYFPKTIQLSDAYKQIGNSVSVPIIERIAKQIAKELR